MGVLLDFRNETTCMLTKDVIGCLFVDLDVMQLVDQIYFNPEHPENHNVRCVPKGVFQVWSGGEWRTHSAYEVAVHMLLKASNIFKTYYAQNYKDIMEVDMTEKEFNETVDTLEHIRDLDKAYVDDYITQIQRRVIQYRYWS